jgi:hypothetical protein
MALHYHVNLIHGGNVYKSHSKSSPHAADDLYNELLEKARQQNYHIRMIGALAKITNQDKKIEVTVVSTRCHFKCT